MTNSGNPPPKLSPAEICDAGLNFYPRTAWPMALPAVAINSLVVAGWGQNMAFNYDLPKDEPEKIAALFRSLYFELSFVEAVYLLDRARTYDWFPLTEVLKRFQITPNELFYNAAERFLKLPEMFRLWCLDKKVAAADLLPLAAAQNINLNPVYLQIIKLRCSKATGTQALELSVDLLLMGHLIDDICNDSLHEAEAWLAQLKKLRFPETSARDEQLSQKFSKLPWPGTSNAKWTRQGDKAGIELKLFVSNPSDLKKYLASLGRVQALMEQDDDPVRAH